MLTKKQFYSLIMISIFSGSFSAAVVVGVMTGQIGFSIVCLFLMFVAIIGILALNYDSVSYGKGNRRRTGDVRIDGKLHDEFMER